MVGSTNHLERLDPGISKRPSRFDRKYEFHNPDEKEREMYMHYWQTKLSDNDDIQFPDKMCPAVAKITKGFSFAYLQEAMVASLLAIARESDGYSERTCLECMEAHGKPESGGTCDRETVRPFKGLFDWAWIVRQVDDEDKDLDNYVLWRELKKQIRILREELGDDKASRRV
jgi:SpoVK/Ycf46/Vps4 family AAA+-type ATPase